MPVWAVNDQMYHSIMYNCHRNKMGENFICGSSLDVFWKSFRHLGKLNRRCEQCWKCFCTLCFVFATDTATILFQVNGCAESVEGIAISSFLLNCKWKKNNFTNTWQINRCEHTPMACWKFSVICLQEVLSSLIQRAVRSHTSFTFFSLSCEQNTNLIKCKETSGFPIPNGLHWRL